MVDKTKLNSSYTYYANIVAAAGFAESSGNFKELVSGTLIGVLGGTTTSRGTDPTHGEYVSLESDDANVNFGDLAAFDGMAQMTLLVLCRNDATSIPGGATDSQYIVTKEGSGAPDSYTILWQNSENVYGTIDAVGDSIVDGLDDGTTGAVATNWNVVSLRYDGANVYVGVNNTKSSGAARTGNVPATAFDLIFGNWSALDRGWLGDIAGWALLDTALSDAKLAVLVSDFVGNIYDPGLNISSVPASITRGSTLSFGVTDPDAAPTTGNTTITFGGENLTVDSVTGSNPYTINCTCPSTIALQHSTTGHTATVTVAAQSAVTSQIPFNEPAGWDYADMTITPVTDSEGYLGYGYTGDAPAIGDQAVYEALTDLSIGPDGEIIWATEPTTTQVFDYYFIQADGTIGPTGTITWLVGGGGGGYIQNIGIRRYRSMTRRKT